MMSPVSSAPVTADERVSDVLSRDEALVEVFARHAPHFEKLRNRALRKVMARLVTVRQAAQVAGVSPDALVRDLNAALGIEAGAEEIRVVDPTSVPSAQRPLDAPELVLDVRDLLRAGGEPFSKIMAAVASLPEGAVLRLRAIFEPAPLYAVLAKRGFSHETRADAADDWSVWFWKANTPVLAPSTESRSVEVTDERDPTTVRLDVRGLEPPEPMLRTLAALEDLPLGHTLVQINNRVPQFLLPVLAERGYACDIDESRADRVLVRIWRP